MAETIEEDINLEEFEMKEETVFKEEEILLSSSVENMCSVYIQGEKVKMENSGIQGKHLI